MVTLYSDPLLFDPFSIGFISVMGAYIAHVHYSISLAVWELMAAQ